MNSRLVRLVAGVVLLAAVAVGAYAVLAGEDEGGGSSAAAEVGPSPTSADDSAATPEGIDTAVAGSNAFAVEAYRALLAADPDANLFFSPYSISSALGMTYEGAKGDTASEIADVFGLDSDPAIRRPAAAALYNRLNPPDAPFELSTANAIWAQEAYPFREDFLDAVERYYAGKSVNLDFAGDPEGSRQTINSWVADETNDRIKDLLPEGSINDLTRMVLTNAIYFKGDWAEQFDEFKTTLQEFHAPDGDVEVEMMARDGEDGDERDQDEYVQPGFAVVDGAKVLELPYRGEELSMLIALPNRSSDLGTLAASISPEVLGSWNEALTRTDVDIFLPKFKLETEYELNPTLSELGMPTAFDEIAADFTGVHNSAGQLYLDQVLHKAFIEVNEEGTEAAAATGATFHLLSGFPQFRADRPFLFLIQDNETGLVLFMGQVTNPAATE